MAPPLFVPKWLLLLLALVAFVLPRHIAAQDYEWHQDYGPSLQPAAELLAVSQEGRLLQVIRGISSSTDINPGTGTFTCSADASFALTFSDQIGQFTGASCIDTTGSTTPTLSALTAGGQDRFWLTGSLTGNGSIDLDGNGTTGLISLSNAQQQAFLVCYDSSGTALWSWVLEDTTASSHITEVKLDAQGNAYVTGWFNGTLDFDPGVGVDTVTSTDQDAFAAKYDTLGNLVWLHTWGASGADAGIDLDVDPLGNTFIALTFAGSTTFYLEKIDEFGVFDWTISDSSPQALAVAVDELSNVIVAKDGDGLYKYNGQGNLQWNIATGGGAQSGVAGIEIDAEGNSYVGDGMAKYDPSGNLIYDLPGFSAIDLSIDLCGNLLLIGASTATSLDLDPDSGTVLLSNPAEPDPLRFTAKYRDSLTTGISLTATITPANCFGDANGSVSLSTSGGKGPYTYYWSNGDSTANNSSLSAGNYPVTVTDLNGTCLITDYTIEQPDSLVPLITPVDTFGGSVFSCHGTSDGSVNLTVTGGTPGYSYNWSGPFAFSSSQANIGGLESGTYFLTVTDSNNCVALDSVILTYQPVLTDSLDPFTYIGGFNISCKNAVDGAITAIPMGGTPGYTYVWNGPNGYTSTSVTATILEQGEYFVTITDTNGCSIVDSVTLNEPQGLQANANATLFPSGDAISCFGANDGVITTATVGGVAGYSYSWTGPSSFTSTANSLSNLMPGSYQLTVTDTNNCTSTSILNLTEPNLLSVQPASPIFTGGLQISCFGASDGAVFSGTFGGSPGYAYNWTGPNSYTSTDQNLMNLDAGTYHVTVTDTNGCSVDSSIMLSEPAALQVTTMLSNFTGGTNVSCEDALDGSVTLTNISGGVPGYLSVLSDSNGVAGSGTVINGLAAGTYFLSIEDTNGCALVDTITLTAPLPLTVTAFSFDTNGFNLTCFESQDGEAAAVVQGGTAGYAYSWSGPNGFSSNAVDPSGLSAGLFQVTITDTNGCQQVDSVTLTQPPDLIPSIAAQDVLCEGDSNGLLMASANGGIAPYTFNWTGPVSGSGATLNNVPAGNYNLEITDVNGCLKSSNETVGFQFMLPVVSLGNDTTTEQSDPLLLDAGSFSSYLWQDGSTAQTFLATVSDTFSVLVTDSNGCMNSDTIAVNIWATGINNPAELMDASVYPNPVRDLLSIQLTSPGSFRLRNSLGQLITAGQTDSFGAATVDLGQQASGLYFLELQVVEGRRVLRVVKQ